MGLRAINLPYVYEAGEIGSVSRLLARVAKWQTRWLQVPVFVRTWGFKSPLAHHGCLRRKRVDTHLFRERIDQSLEHCWFPGS